MPSTAQTLGLYLSVPFCRSKCSFCNFASNVYSASHHAHYVERLCEELCTAAGLADLAGAHLPRLVDTIYLGGGTPSVLEPGLLRQLFAAIREHFQLTPDAEITMECAPGQIADATLAAMAASGVNRVSLGVQSFLDREAATTGRLHNRAVTLHDLDRLRAAGIGRISLDLIAGLPHQTLDSWSESLTVLVETGVQHASIYMLEIDDESRLGRELLAGGARYHAGAVPGDDTIATMFELAAHCLAAAGLQQYEISNYAVAGQHSKHNMKYWTQRPYLGIGLDAHSMLRSVEGNAEMRFNSSSDLASFLDGPAGPQQLQRLTPHAELEEAWFLGLRLAAGVHLGQLRARFGAAAVARFLPAVEQLSLGGLVSAQGDRVTLTQHGQLVSNEVFAQILEAGDEEFAQQL